MQTKIYFDGACSLCSREMGHYRRKEEADCCDFIDIAAPGFNASSEGLDPQRVIQAMHVRDAEGKLHVGVDAFLEIWKLFPKYRALVPIAQLPGIHHLLRCGYYCFAKMRHLLPKKASYCEIGSCKK